MVRTRERGPLGSVYILFLLGQVIVLCEMFSVYNEFLCIQFYESV